MAYDAKTGRWLTRDPTGESGGANLYEAFNNDPINWDDPDGTTAKRSTLGGSDTTDFHSTKEVAVLPDGSRQVTYRLFLARTAIFSPGVGAPGQTIRSEQQVSVAQQTFAGANAAQTEAVVDKSVASRVDSLNQINQANALTDNISFGFGFIPFFTAVDHWKRGEPWKLDAAISALSLAPAVASAAKSLAMGAETSAVLKTGAAGIETGATSDALGLAKTGMSACFPAGTSVSVIRESPEAATAEPLVVTERARAAKAHEYWEIGALLSATALVGCYILHRKHRGKFDRRNEDSADSADPAPMPLLPGLGNWDSFLPCLAVRRS